MSDETLSLLNEIWKPIIGYEGFYDISNMGRIRSLDRIVDRPRGNLIVKHKCKGKIRTISKMTNYPGVTLSRDGIKKSHFVHKLVATNFIGERPNGLVIDHIDGNIFNSCQNNLRYISNRDNVIFGLERKGRVLPTGVRKVGNRYRAITANNGKKIHIGMFDTPQQAYHAYTEMVKTFRALHTDKLKGL